jgi:hypothetical protein
MVKERNTISEDFVTYNIMKFLKKDKWEIVQYHPPGGQAHIGISVSKEIIFPDIIANKKSKIIVAENKINFTESDIIKLNGVRTEEDAKLQIIQAVKDFCTSHGIPMAKQFQFFFVHGFIIGEKEEHTEDNVNLMGVRKDGTIHLIHSKNDQLVL